MGRSDWNPRSCRAVLHGALPLFQRLLSNPAPLKPPALLPPRLHAAGETQALKQLRTFLARAGGGSAGSAGGAASRGSNFSNHIAPWLATGCLSPRYMLEQARAALGGGSGSAGGAGGAPAAPAAQGASAAQRSSGSGVDPLAWVSFELLWRDFFRFISLKYSAVPTGKMGAAGSGGGAAAAQAAPALAAAV